jgi:hypothetical protein
MTSLPVVQKQVKLNSISFGVTCICSKSINISKIMIKIISSFSFCLGVCLVLGMEPRPHVCQAHSLPWSYTYSWDLFNFSKKAGAELGAGGSGL